MFNRPLLPVLLVPLLEWPVVSPNRPTFLKLKGLRLPRIQEVKPPSELALLMRLMAIHADSVKAAVQQERELPPYPSEIKTLFMATPTEGMHIDPITYPTFGQDYINKVDRLYAGAREDRSKLYNALVQGCANCHTTHCPGPMMRIKKMYMPVEG